LSAIDLLLARGGRSAALARRLGEDDRTVAELLDAAEVLAALTEFEAVQEVLSDARDLCRVGAHRALRADVEWRLAQIAEVFERFADAATHYEAAAEAFRAEREHAEEAIARMRLAEARTRAFGAGEALGAAKDAIPPARASGDLELVAKALIGWAELFAEVGAYEDAIVRLREAGRLAIETGPHLETLAARAAIGESEARLALGDLPRAIDAAQRAGTHLELADDAHVKTRSLALLALITLSAASQGPLTKEHEASIRAAREGFRQVGDLFGHARFLMRVGQQVKRLDGAADALPWLIDAWNAGRSLPERFRLAPLAFALSRCFADLERWVEADFIIEEALLLTEEVSDLQGLELCTELGVVIAIALDVANLATTRLMGLARARARMGDTRGETRSLLAALELASRNADSEVDIQGIAAELMDAVRRTGGEDLAPGEFAEVAQLMGYVDSPEFERELYEMRGHKAMADGRLHEGARSFALAAKATWRMRDRSDAGELLSRVIQIAKQLGITEVEGIRITGGGAGDGDEDDDAT